MSIENTIGSTKADMLARMQMHREVVSGVAENRVESRQLDFSHAMKSTLSAVNAQQLDAAKKVESYELGLSDDLIGVTVASQKASLSFSALMQVRNKLVTGFDDIIKMPL
ncbi:flagellar hook-basal body complex protein FliE [Vibrio sp. PNB22_3_1]